MSNAWKYPPRPVTDTAPSPWFSVLWLACLFAIATLLVHVMPKMLAEKACIDLNPTTYQTECRK